MHKKKLSIPTSIFFIFIFLISACNGDKSTYKVVRAKMRPVEFKLDTTICEIKIDPTRLFSYKIFSVTKNGIFCGYNRSRSKLDLFDLHNKKILKEVAIDKNGPNQIRNMDAIYMHNEDSIFVLTGNDVKLMDTSGRVKRAIPINHNAKNKESIFASNVFITSSLFSNFFYNAMDHCLYFQNDCTSIGSCQKEYYKTATVGKINLAKNDAAELLPFSYSNLYQDGYFGFLVDPIISILNNGSVAVGFPIEPEVAVYDYVTKKTTLHGTFPDKNADIANSLNWGLCYEDDKKMKHFIESPIYGALLSDSWKKLNYRFQLGPVQYEKRGKSFTSLNDKPVLLSILNDKMELMKSISIPDTKVWVYTAFVLGDGIYVPAPRGEDNLRFKILKIKKI